MSQQAFIVKLNLDDGIDAQSVVDDITENLVQDGYQVISVAPWKTQDEAESMGTSLGLIGGQPTSDQADLGVPGLGGI